MGKSNKKLAEEHITYHETNLASLIEHRNTMLKDKSNGVDVSEYAIDKTDRTIADIENIIYNWRTKGRGYD